MNFKLSPLLFSFFVSIYTFGQTDKELEIKDFFWGKNDSHKNETKIPDKWKNESAVILYKNENYDFHKFGTSVTYANSSRNRIKLLDKSAVEEFSKFSIEDLFKPKKEFKIVKKIGENSGPQFEKYLGIKIIKPDGTETEIDIKKESVQVDNTTKIAVSNLEIGDIIDYYLYEVEIFKSSFAFGFDPVETTISENYPIVDYKLFFETENDFFINFNSYNGAPPLIQIDTEKKNMRRYSLTASDIEKANYPIWLYPLVEYPCYKFQAVFARNGIYEDLALAFLPEKEDIIKKDVSKSEVLDLYKSRFDLKGGFPEAKSFCKENTFKNNSEKVKAYYYYMRHYNFTRFIEGISYEQNKIILNLVTSYYGNSYTRINNQKYFVKYFTEFLKQENIDYEIIIAQKRENGNINDLLIQKNVDVLVKVNTEEPIYLDWFRSHYSINQFSPLLEGTDVYLLSGENGKFNTINKGVLPKRTASENESINEFSVNLDDDFSSLKINKITSHKGHQKNDEQNNRLQFHDYVYEDYNKYKTKPYLDYVNNKNQKVDHQNKIEAYISKLKEKQKDIFKNSTKLELGLENDLEDYSYKINETGRYGFESNFTFTESFKIKEDFIKKVNSNYIIEIGKLIGQQIKINDKDRIRKENIYLSHPKTYINKITLNIPEGYSVSGLDKLNVSIDNSTGAFISNAKIEGSKLIITTTKQYKNYYEPNSNWELMVEFLDAANQFTNEKILLKKL